MSVYQEIASNKRKTWVVVGGFFAFTALIVWLAGWIWGLDWFTIGFFFILAGISSGIGYWFSDQVILTLSGARPADRQRDFQFYTVTENLALAARLPMPKLYVIEDTAMNAFATGRDPQHAVICATTGILARLNRTELEGVVAHELSHVRNYDIRLMSVVAVLVGLIALLADVFLRWGMLGGRRRSSDNRGGGEALTAIFFVVGIILIFLSPIIAQLIQLAISRNREFLADASGAKLTGYPPGLASALAKLNQDHEPLEAANKATAHLYIVNPLHDRQDAVGWFSGLFATHPPMGERIKRLQSM
jgi:heat shock protein HtpX